MLHSQKVQVVKLYQVANVDDAYFNTEAVALQLKRTAIERWLAW
jgi:hypothetical protein